MEHRLWATLLLAFSAAGGAASEPVAFPGPGVELAGRLYRPAGAGPFPAIVLMHGCSGMWRRDGLEPNANYASWAEHWRAQGFIALLVDSFGPRGEREICTQRQRRIRPDRERPRDAYASLAWLAGRADVMPGHVHLQGWSNGGMAVLNTVKTHAPGRPDSGPEFRSAVAFYPGCAALARTAFESVVPLLIQSGGADDWTPARQCERLASRSRRAGAPVEIDVYPGAHHGFDGFGAIRVRPDLFNPAAPGGWGATVGGNPEVRQKALERTTRWIEARER